MYQLEIKNKRNIFLAANLNVLIPISLQPDVVPFDISWIL